jgi:signal peptidase I
MTEPASPDGNQPLSRVERRRLEKAEQSQGRRRNRLEVVAIIGGALIIAVLIRAFVFQAFSIPSASMENTLLIGDRILVSKLSYRLGEVERGDVVVFDGSDSFVSEPPTVTADNALESAWLWFARLLGLAPGERDFVKRVIGVGGDRVICCDDSGRITVNGVALDETEYLFPGDSPSRQEFDVEVPAGKLWLMGDHRSVSRDSRAYLGSPGGGFVSTDKVIGRAISVVWPPSRWSGLGTPSTFTNPALTSATP